MLYLNEENILQAMEDSKYLTLTNVVFESIKKFKWNGINFNI